ncbi:unnamed protein product [Polarella glacialis]|uniref:Uncharacterized protein n=1 Tax=Polarella glacialis TaxID=89957 RepID=A0A813GIY8_POLGL|nr:unnamed protein product [Polarella glacialis]
MPAGSTHSSTVFAVPYIEVEKGVPVCLLCGHRGLEHFASAGHAAAEKLWTELLARMTQLESELRSEVSNESSSFSEVLARAWIGEIRYVAGQDEERFGQVQQAFAQLMLGQRLSAAAGSLVGVQQAFDRALTDANRTPEPMWKNQRWQLPPPPAPEHDFPWSSRPHDVTLKLSAATPPEVFDALSIQALSREGISAQPDGGLWCSHCEVAVLSLREHLGPPSAEAQHHLRQRSSATSSAARLRSEGWKLSREGLWLSQHRFHCGLCTVSGSWRLVWEHRSSHCHVEACAALSKNASAAAVQSRALHSLGSDAEQAWEAAFKAADRLGE